MRLTRYFTLNSDDMWDNTSATRLPGIYQARVDNKLPWLCIDGNVFLQQPPIWRSVIFIVMPSERSHRASHIVMVMERATKSHQFLISNKVRICCHWAKTLNGKGAYYSADFWMTFLPATFLLHFVSLPFTFSSHQSLLNQAFMIETREKYQCNMYVSQMNM